MVLATGMVPNTSTTICPVHPEADDDGFGSTISTAGVTVAGVARRPEDVAASVRDATGAAAKAWAVAGRRA